MSRAERRQSLASFRRDASGGFLDVFVVAAEDISRSAPLLQNAVQFWRGNLQQGRPCVACKTRLASDAHVGAYLCMVPSSAPQSCSVSGVCLTCWLNASDQAIKAASLRVVRKVLPTAVFDAEPPR